MNRERKRQMREKREIKYEIPERKWEKCRAK